MSGWKSEHAVHWQDCSAFDPQWMEIARAELGQREHPGARNSNPRIVEYIRTAGFEYGDETPWCSAFVNWVMRQVGYSRTGHLGARSWLHWGKPTLGRYGAITVLTRPGAQHSWAGHVGFLLREEGERFFLLGGNQHDQVSVVEFPKARLLGYRWPIEQEHDARRRADELSV